VLVVPPPGEGGHQPAHPGVVDDHAGTSLAVAALDAGALTIAEGLGVVGSWHASTVSRRAGD
jgi:hypothetical protein